MKSGNKIDLEKIRTENKNRKKNLREKKKARDEKFKEWENLPKEQWSEDRKKHDNSIS